MVRFATFIKTHNLLLCSWIYVLIRGLFQHWGLCECLSQFFYCLFPMFLRYAFWGTFRFHRNWNWNWARLVNRFEICILLLNYLRQCKLLIICNGFFEKCICVYWVSRNNLNFFQYCVNFNDKIKKTYIRRGG